MNEERDGFHGWVKWVVVIAALMTITGAMYEFIKGFTNYQPTQIERKR